MRHHCKCIFVGIKIEVVGLKSLLLIKAVRVACRSVFVQSVTSIAVVQSGSSIATLTC
jgi:hypothetical protein